LDPQTSGGLLFALPKDQAEILVKNLNNQDHTAAVIGEITQNPGFDFE
jgi:hydrogenase maturation factor